MLMYCAFFIDIFFSSMRVFLVDEILGKALFTYEQDIRMHVSGKESKTCLPH